MPRTMRVGLFHLPWPGGRNMWDEWTGVNENDSPCSKGTSSLHEWAHLCDICLDVIMYQFIKGMETLAHWARSLFIPIKRIGFILSEAHYHKSSPTRGNNISWVINLNALVALQNNSSYSGFACFLNYSNRCWTNDSNVYLTSPRLPPQLVWKQATNWFG